MWERVGNQRRQGFSEQVPSGGENGKQGGSDGWEVEPRVLEVATSKSQIRGVPRWKVTEPEQRLELLELKRRECRACQTWDVGAARQRGGNSGWIVSWRSMDTQGELIVQGMEEASKWLAVSSSSVPKMLGGEDWEQKRLTLT